MRRRRTRRLVSRRMDAVGEAIPSETAPEGTVSEVLAWVGDDQQRARQALEAEREGRQRETLLDKLERLTTQA